MLAYYELIKSSWLAPDNKTVTARHAGIAHVYQGLILDRALEKDAKRTWA
jgi:hypothetical protein